MATSANNTNSFSLTGYVAVEATVKSFDKSAVARFPLSISRTEANGDEQVRKSALINCECWRKSAEADTFDLLKKGKLIQISGFVKPEEWTSEDGSRHNRIIFVVTSVTDPATTGEANKPAKGKKRAA